MQCSVRYAILAGETVHFDYFISRHTALYLPIGFVLLCVTIGWAGVIGILVMLVVTAVNFWSAAVPWSSCSSIAHCQTSSLGGWTITAVWCRFGGCRIGKKIKTVEEKEMKAADERLAIIRQVVSSIESPPAECVICLLAPGASRD